MRHAAGAPPQSWLSMRRATRPSFLKSLSVSLLLHATVVSAIFAWPQPTKDRFTVAGRRHVLYLQATNAVAPPVHVVAEPERIESDARAPIPHVERTSPPESFEPATRPQRAARVALPLSALADAPSPISLPEATAIEMHRKPPELPEVQSELREPERRLARHAASPPPLQSPSTPPQVAVGLDDERFPADLSSNPFPAYPAEAVRLRLEGTVLLRLRIDQNGDVQQVEIARSSGHVLLDRSAAEAVSSWRGKPAQRGGRPVATTEWLPIRFRL